VRAAHGVNARDGVPKAGGGLPGLWARLVVDEQRRLGGGVDSEEEVGAVAGGGCAGLELMRVECRGDGGRERGIMRCRKGGEVCRRGLRRLREGRCGESGRK